MEERKIDIITEEQDRQFSASVDAMAIMIQERNAEKGFWDEGRMRNKGELMALMHSEISEMLEAVRRKVPAMAEKVPEFTEEEEELADLFIRGLDYAGGFGLRLGDAILAKLKYNAMRPFKHGKTC